MVDWFRSSPLSAPHHFSHFYFRWLVHPWHLISSVLLVLLVLLLWSSLQSYPLLFNDCLRGTWLYAAALYIFSPSCFWLWLINSLGLRDFTLCLIQGALIYAGPIWWVVTKLHQLLVNLCHLQGNGFCLCVCTSSMFVISIPQWLEYFIHSSMNSSISQCYSTSSNTPEELAIKANG